MYDVTIVGCGIAGAALAYTLSRYDLRVLVLERENDVAMGATKANSAIAHAGYDPEPGTLMARLNVRGSEMMEDLCKALDVRYRRCGSFVVAFDDAQVEHLRRLYDRGVENGVKGMRLLSGAEARAMEPNLAENVCGALYAPSAAIIDPWGLCIALAETAVKNGVEIRLCSGLTGIEDCGDHLLLHTESGDVETRYAANCAGGYAHAVCAMTGVTEWKAQAKRGEYYLLDKTSGNLVSRTIFQCPTAVGKGVLLSPTVHGNLIVGPNACSVPDARHTETTAAGLEEVAAAARKSVPSVDLRQSIRNFAGIRAETDQPDFIIRPAKAMPRLLHVAGIKSPGLTSAPAIGEYATGLLQEMGLELTEKTDWDGTRKVIRFKELPDGEKRAVIARDPRYGKIICRCETITEGEIVAAIHSPIPPCSVDGVKRRAGAGMGRCQGGFCGPRVVDILARELGKDPSEILQDGQGTQILFGRTKEGSRV